MIEIYCSNTKTFQSFPIGTTLKQIAEKMTREQAPLFYGALVNHRVKAMDYEINRPVQILFFDFAHQEGRKMYLRSLSFLLYVAIQELYPEVNLRIDHAISKGYFCELNNLGRKLTEEDVWSIEEEMKKLISDDITFERHSIRNEQAVELFERAKLHSKTELFKFYGRLYAPYNLLKGYPNFFYGHLVPSTKFISCFAVELHNNGILLRFPIGTDVATLPANIKQEKLFDVIREHKDWASILGIEDIAKLNEVIRNGKEGEIIKVAEALHERKVAQLAIAIQTHSHKPKIILIAGPSSSGKTTFSKRLAIQLKVSGYQPHLLSMDDYFVNRVDTPLDENGEYNFEALEAVDIPFFNQQLCQLLNGEKIETPRFDFVKGERVKSGEKLKLHDSGVLIIEGIHALNPNLLTETDVESTYKIFISALTQISIDEHNYISSSDTRFIRRIIRDYKYRNYSPCDTIERWPSVRKGEEEYIFPHQENADIVFNSALLYELGVMKSHIEPLLKRVKETSEEYTDAVRLLNFISYFEEIDESEIPPTSILREFLGGSSFEE